MMILLRPPTTAKNNNIYINERLKVTCSPSAHALPRTLAYVRPFKTCTTDIYLHNEGAHVGLSIDAPYLNTRATPHPDRVTSSLSLIYTLLLLLLLLLLLFFFFFCIPVVLFSSSGPCLIPPR
eukprot:COSAG05_NODE_701_length_7861_cov_46.560423_1_plen_123_part_00